jgi:hypothetical protein
VKRYFWDLPKQAQQEGASAMQAGDYAGLLKSAAMSAPGVGFARDVMQAQLNQAQQARQSAQQGNYSEAFGHGLAAALPLLGPPAAQAGEQIGSGDIAGGLGSGTALLAPFAAGAATALAPARAGTEVARMLDAAAEKNWAKALNPTTRANKAIVQDVVAPGLRERGVVATSLDDLRDRAAGHMDNFGGQIDDYMQQHGSDAVQGKGGTAITSRIDQNIALKQRSGVTPKVNQPYVDTLNDFKKEVNDLAAANGGVLTLEDARWLRQQYDVPAAAKNAFALPPAESSKLAAIRDAANTLRGVIADQNPALAATNKEFSFWNRVHDVTDATLERRQGQKPPLTTSLAQGGGAILGSGGGPVNAYAASKAAGILAQLRNSTIWNSFSAATKAQLSDLAASGDLGGMFQVATATGPALSPHNAIPALTPGRP